jgi:hypothetical protein
MNITDYNQNFQNQRVPPGIASFHNRLGTAQNQNTSNLAPIQTAFRQLSKDPLFQSTLSNKTNFKADSSAQWTMARAEALFDAVYASGQTNDRDIQQIHDLSREASMLQEILKGIRSIFLNTGYDLHVVSVYLHEEKLFLALDP